MPKAAAATGVSDDKVVVAKLRSTARPVIPNCSETDEMELNGMVRAQSLRDLTSKFEKMGNPGVIASPSKGNFFLLEKMIKSVSFQSK